MLVRRFNGGNGRPGGFQWLRPGGLSGSCCLRLTGLFAFGCLHSGCLPGFGRLRSGCLPGFGRLRPGGLSAFGRLRPDRLCRCGRPRPGGLHAFRCFRLSDFRGFHRLRPVRLCRLNRLRLVRPFDFGCLLPAGPIGFDRGRFILRRQRRGVPPPGGLCHSGHERIRPGRARRQRGRALGFGSGRHPDVPCADAARREQRRQQNGHQLLHCDSSLDACRSALIPARPIPVPFPVHIRLHGFTHPPPEPRQSRAGPPFSGAFFYHMSATGRLCFASFRPL